MSTAASPTSPSSQLTSDQLTAATACLFSMVFFVVIVILLSIIYRKYPLCCKLHSYQTSHSDMVAPPRYYSSRQSLVGSPCVEETQILDDNNIQQAGQLFYIGLPSSYSLSTLEAPLPRLPSYESVRKKDRQRQIHMMIAARFGLNGPIVTESPPTYEESIRQSMALPYNMLSPSFDCPPSQTFYTNTRQDNQTDSSYPLNTDTISGVIPV